jgi:hypothetical protein
MTRLPVLAATLSMAGAAATPNLFGHLRVDRLVGRRHMDRAEPEEEEHGGGREKGNARGRPL